MKMQEELVLDYEAEQSNPIVIDDNDDEDDNVTVTINNSAEINYPTVAYVYNKEDNTYNVTNSELELKSRIDVNRLNQQLENYYTDSHLRQYYEIKQHYLFLQNVPVSQRINVPLFSDLHDEKVNRILVVPFVIAKPAIHEVIYNLINGPWLAKPKPRIFKISSDYIKKYIDQLNESELFKSAKHLKLSYNYIAILATSYFKVGKAKCLASISIGFFHIEDDVCIKLIDFVTVNHSNVKNFQHNEDRLKEMIKKYNIVRIYCWLPNYGTIYNTLYGNVYWFNKILIDTDGNNRLQNLFGKMTMEKNLDTTTVCVNSIEHSNHCSYCNMIRLAIKMFNSNQQQLSPAMIDHIAADRSLEVKKKFYKNLFTSPNAVGKTPSHVNRRYHKLSNRNMRDSKLFNPDGSCYFTSFGGFKSKSSRCSHKECNIHNQSRSTDKFDGFYDSMFAHNRIQRYRTQRNFRQHYCR